MKKLLCLCLALVLCLPPCTSLAAEYYSYAAIMKGDEVAATPQELETAMRRALLVSALNSAAQGREYDTVDSLNIIDQLSKVLFDLEQRYILWAQAGLMDLPDPTDDELLQAYEHAQALWLSYRDIALSENGTAYLPAGNYEPVPDDPEETIARYFASFGLTQYALFQDEADLLAEKYLFQAVTANMADASEDEKLENYADWIVKLLEEADFQEDPLAIAEVCMNLVR